MCSVAVRAGRGRGRRKSSPRDTDTAPQLLAAQKSRLCHRPLSDGLSEFQFGVEIPTRHSFAIPPTFMNPEGKTVVGWEGQTKLRY